MSHEPPKPDPLSLNLPGEVARLAEVAYGRLAHYRRMREAYDQAGASLRAEDDAQAIDLNLAALAAAVARCRAVIADADATAPAIVRAVPKAWRPDPNGGAA